MSKFSNYILLFIFLFLGLNLYSQSSPALGDTHQGGIVFYLDGNGGGLVAAPSEQSTGAVWGCPNTQINARSSSGSQNTIIIVAAGCNTPGTAASICANLSIDSYSDWFLPSSEELNLMYQNIGQGNSLGLGNIGGFANNWYWSSTELDGNDAERRNFSNNQLDDNKNYPAHVRAVRAFTSKTYVPDDNFEAYLETHDGGGNLVWVGHPNSLGDGIASNDSVLTSRINTLGNFECNGESINDITGIEDFTSLTYLWVMNNNLSSIDLSNLTMLQDFNCNENNIQNLDLNSNVSIQILRCSQNQLTHLDVSQNNLLTILTCYDNSISALDVSHLSSLSEFQCQDNSLISLDIRNGNNINIALVVAGGNANLNCISVDDQTWGNLFYWNVDSHTSFSNDCSVQATTWTGAVNSDWNNAGNWSAGIPDNTDDIVISGGSNNPTINTAGATCKNLTISSGGSITISDASYSINVDTLKIENGAQVTISSGDVYTNNVIHSGTLNISGGTLDIDDNYTASGNITTNISGGTIKVEGNWTATGNGFTPTGGTVEFSGSAAQAISLASGNNFYDLKINNSNATDEVYAQGSALVVSNHLNITDGIFYSASDYHDVTIASGSTLQLTGDITVSGNWTNNGTFQSGNHTVTFDGSTAQSISGSDSTFFGNLTINNSSNEVILNSVIAVLGTLNFNQGVININSQSLHFADGSTFTGASDFSHAYNGPLLRFFNPPGNFTSQTGFFPYPVGDGINHRPINLYVAGININVVSVAYLFANQNQSSLNSSLSSIETYGWDIQRGTGSDGFNITIPYDASYGISDFNNLTIAMFDGTEWTEVPSTVTGTATSGSVTTNSSLSDFSNRYFALGYKSTVDADFSADATTICEETTVTFTDASSGSAGINSWSWNFSDGTTSTSTSTLQNPTHTYNTAGTYDVSLTVNGSDTETKTSYITVNPNPTVSAGSDQNGCSNTYYTFNSVGQWNPYADFNANMPSALSAAPYNFPTTQTTSGFPSGWEIKII